MSLIGTAQPCSACPATQRSTAAGAAGGGGDTDTPRRSTDCASPRSNHLHAFFVQSTILEARVAARMAEMAFTPRQCRYESCGVEEVSVLTSDAGYTLIDVRCGGRAERSARSPEAARSPSPASRACISVAEAHLGLIWASRRRAGAHAAAVRRSPPHACRAGLRRSLLRGMLLERSTFRSWCRRQMAAPTIQSFWRRCTQGRERGSAMQSRLCSHLHPPATI